ncbi:MAG: prenyltransferase/squalene oxidase repeat-containing protein [Euryarchaeota archaeon]
MRRLIPALAALLCLAGAATAHPVDWGPVIDKAARYWVAVDEAKRLAQQTSDKSDPRYYLFPSRVQLHASEECVYWTAKYGHAKWEKSGEVIYGSYAALSSIYAALLSGEVHVKDWPEPYRSRMATAVTTALAKLLSLQQKDGGWGWQVILSSGKTRFPAGLGHVLRTAQILADVLIPALRLNIREVTLGGSRYDVAKCAQAAVRFLIDQQLSDGGYSSNKDFSKTPDPLYTGQALRALCEAYRYRDLIGLSEDTVKQIKQAIQKAVQWLESHQNPPNAEAGPNLWEMQSAAIMGSPYAPPSEATLLLGLIDAYSLADELGLDKNKLADSINRALKAIVDWAAQYSSSSVVQFDGKKAVGWAYSNSRLSGVGPYVVHTARVLMALTLAQRLGLGQSAIQELKQLGATMESEQEWLYRECVQYDGLAAFPYPNRENFSGVTASSQMDGILCAVAFSHPEVFLQRTTADVHRLIPNVSTTGESGKGGTGRKAGKRSGIPLHPMAVIAALALLRRRH